MDTNVLQTALLEINNIFSLYKDSEEMSLLIRPVMVEPRFSSSPYRESALLC